MIIRETKINDKENWKTIYQYELFVIDKIKLPARLVIHLWQPVNELCTLEIKTINLISLNSYPIQRAIKITNDVDAKN